MNTDISLSANTLNISGKSYELESVEGSYIINRQTLKLLYAFMGLFWLVFLVLIAFITLTQVTSIPGNLSYLVLVLMVYPSFLIGRAILKRFYFPELVLTSNGKVVLRIVEWPKYHSIIETIKGRVTNIKVSYPLDLRYRRIQHP